MLCMLPDNYMDPIGSGGAQRMASILVVDDTRSTCTALAAILGREGHTVVTATSGAEALAHLETSEVDLLLCDVRMPKMDGLTVLRRAKAPDGGIAVVIISGYIDITVSVRARYNRD